MIFEDSPKLLANADAVHARKEQLQEPHILPLKEFVDSIRKRSSCGERIPYFDPWDGGVNAEVLFLLEAPGPKSLVSGFISRNNPDETAKNFFELSTIERKRTAIWNIVPWHIHVEVGSDPGDYPAAKAKSANIRPASGADIARGKVFLDELLGHLPNLKAVVLVGGKAQKVRPHLYRNWPSLKVFECPHPSPQFINRSKEKNKNRIRDAMKQVETYINSGLERFGWSSINQVVITKVGGGA